MRFDIEWLYDIYILEAWHIFSIVFSIIFLCTILLNARKSWLLNYYMILHLILLDWMICKVLKTVAPTVASKWFFIAAQYFPLSYLGSALLMFGYYYGKKKHLSLKSCIFLNIPPTVFFIGIITNEYHHLFYSTYDFLGDTFGPLFYISTAVMYLYMSLGIYFCASHFIKEQGESSAEAKLLTAGIIVPLIVNALYILGIVEFRFDFTPISSNISLVLFAYAIWKYNFLDIVNIGISISLDHMREGVIITNTEGLIIDYNKGIFDVLNFQNGDIPYDTVEKILDYLKVDEKGMIRIMGKTNSLDYIKHYSKPILDGKDKVRGYTHVFVDTTYYRELALSLEQKNEEQEEANKKIEEYVKDIEYYSAIEERNRVAKEIHDILGHSLSLITAVLEGGLILLKTDYLKAEEKGRQALKIAEAGYEEMKNVLSGKIRDRGDSMKELLDDLNNLAESFRSSGVEVSCDIVGEPTDINENICNGVFRICQEGLTNALRHGNAGEVDIFIRFSEKELEIFVIDNGKGCKEIVKGHGLRGMEERIEKLKGTLTYGSPESAGFTIHGSIPIANV